MTSLTTEQLSLFALDCYMHEAGVETVDVPLGATIIAPTLNRDGFSATAYKVNGEIVIAYAGTNLLSPDPVTGWPVAWGAAEESSQAMNACAFFRQVQQDNPGYEITVTGHSLGGGLAGFVSSLLHVNGVLFDNMPFRASSIIVNSAAELAVTDVGIFWRHLLYDNGPVTDPTFNQTAWHIIGEAMQYLRGPGPDPSHGLSVGDGQFPAPLPVSLHSMSMLTTRLYADNSEHHINAAWSNAAKYIFPQLFSADVAQAAGVDQIVMTQFGSTSSTDVLQEVIAYSASNGSAGNAAIDAFYANAVQLG